MKVQAIPIDTNGFSAHRSVNRRVRASLRLGTTPFTKEAAASIAKRLRGVVEADPKKQNLKYWAGRMGLGDVELEQVLEVLERESDREVL